MRVVDLLTGVVKGGGTLQIIYNYVVLIYYTSSLISNKDNLKNLQVFLLAPLPLYCCHSTRFDRDAVLATEKIKRIS
jgi:hypothetical protein